MDNRALKARTREFACNDVFVARWSPRAMSAEPVTEEELFTLFEAARWAPSAFNGQPWRFIYALRDTPQWDILFGLLKPGNQEWAKNAATLVVMISRETFEHNDKPSRTHSFDTGAAWISLALQGQLSGLVVHGMSGFDYQKAKENLKIPDGYKVEAMCAIGKPGSTTSLPDKLQEREVPNTRKKVKEFAFEGTFGGK